MGRILLTVALAVSAAMLALQLSSPLHLFGMEGNAPAGTLPLDAPRRTLQLQEVGATTPAAPTFVSATLISITLRWSAPSISGCSSGNISAYSVEREQVSGYGVFVESYNGLPTPTNGIYSTTITVPPAAGAYRVRVAAVCAVDGVGWYSASTNMSTLPSVGVKPNIPTPVLTAATSNSLTVGWAYPGTSGELPTGYTLMYSTSPTGTYYPAGGTVAAASLSATMVTTAGLAANTPYYVKINSRSNAGDTAFSSPVAMTTAAYPSCPGTTACSGHGTCVAGACQCSKSYLLSDCSLYADFQFSSSDSTFQMYWTYDITNVYVQLVAPTTGWVGLMLSSDDSINSMQNTDVWMASVKAVDPLGWKTTLLDAAGTGYIAPAWDQQQDLSGGIGWEDSGSTIVAFQRRRTTNDTSGFDCSITTGNMNIAWAYGSSDVMSSQHAASGRGVVNWLQQKGTPSAPTGISYTATSSSISLSWAAPLFAGSGGTVNTYTVQFSSSSTGDFSTIYSGLPTVGSDGYYSISLASGLPASTTYFIKMAAGNTYSSDLGTYSDPLSVATLSATGAVPNAPVAPTLSTATATSIVVAWTAPTTHEAEITWYKLQYSASSTTGPWTALGDRIASNYTSNTLTALTPGTTYYVQVAAASYAGASAWSASSSLATVAAALPDTVTTLTLSDAESTTLVASWMIPATHGADITAFKLQWSSSSSTGPWIAVATQVSATTVKSTLTGLPSSSTIYVQVSSVTAFGSSAWSTSASLTTLVLPSPPDAPATPNVGLPADTSIYVQWAAPATHGSAIVGYIVQWSPTGTSGTWIDAWSNLASPLTPLFQITSLPSGTTIYARVQALSMAGPSGWSSANMVSTTGSSAPSAPAAPTLTAASRTSVTVTWVAPVTHNSAITCYTVRYSTGSATGPWTLISNVTTLSTIITGLSSGTIYVQVAAVSAAGTSPYSNSATLSMESSSSTAGLSSSTARLRFSSSTADSSSSSTDITQSSSARSSSDATSSSTANVPSSSSSSTPRSISSSSSSSGTNGSTTRRSSSSGISSSVVVVGSISSSSSTIGITASSFAASSSSTGSDVIPREVTSVLVTFRMDREVSSLDSSWQVAFFAWLASYLGVSQARLMLESILAGSGSAIVSFRISPPSEEQITAGELNAQDAANVFISNYSTLRVSQTELSGASEEVPTITTVVQCDDSIYRSSCSSAEDEENHRDLWEKKPFWIWIIIGVGSALILLLLIASIVWHRRQAAKNVNDLKYLHSTVAVTRTYRHSSALQPNPIVESKGFEHIHNDML